MSIAAVPRPRYVGYYNRTAAESAALAFGILAFIVEIVIFIVHLFDLQKSNGIKSIPMNIVVRNFFIIIIEMKT